MISIGIADCRKKGKVKTKKEKMLKDLLESNMRWTGVSEKDTEDQVV